MPKFQFARIDRLPPYVFAVVNDLKTKLRRAGEDIVDLGMGNPDLPTPQHIVDKLCEAAQNPKNHRYSQTKGLYRLREALALWYKRKYNVDLDPETEVITTIGSKEGLAHLALTLINPGDVAIVPSPAYPIHPYSIIIAGGDVRSVPLFTDDVFDEEAFFESIVKAYKESWPRPKVLILNFPHNPTTACVSLKFFEKVVDFAKENNLIVIQDIAYAEISFDGYVPPSILQVKDAKEVAVEFYSLSKTYSMAGWRVGFAAGNKEIIHALYRMKSYLDYGMFQPIQIAAIIALKGDQSCVEEYRKIYERRRDVLVEGLNRIGWKVEKPKSTMFVWAKIPEQFQSMGSLEFAKMLLLDGKVAVSPGIGFGEYGDKYVRFALVENELRIKQAVRGIKRAFEKYGLRNIKV
ncbi:aminotransferase class I/II-fold pyridoxal phosphate-dependent enzyme [Phorcysia thermohydrogeniphila]|uniref:Aminotransferase n=1 Tax=Phorcysia thermohydrogeniphila TaxID=936138 RepID=A0A4R1GDA8_9BACT|nr:aminotransferase class I/II-fold pyridoxal phosphate-dependent enzyme [Phorcysia thermohydrogeniphila]TCK04555.1 alanine-synthesizing transaminase [Phorcysia thermohydrogeniphila]